MVLQLFAAAGIIFAAWLLYRFGYEDGRKFELECEIQRLEKEHQRLVAEGVRLEAEYKARRAQWQA